MSLSIKTLCIECHYAECHFAECHYAECRYVVFVPAKDFSAKQYLQIIRLGSSQFL